MRDREVEQERAEALRLQDVAHEVEGRCCRLTEPDFTL